MTQVASSASVVGQFEGVELTRAGRQYRLGRDEAGSWVESQDVLASHEGSASATRQDIVLCTGSHHMQVYWMSTGRGREVAQFPFVWLIAEQKWIPRESSFLLLPSAVDPAAASIWNESCITCHTTHGKKELHPSEPPQSTVAEFGISCEACHGPGERHVQHHRSTTKSETDTDPIVHPLRLSHERASEVCGQCHMAWHRHAPGSDLTFRPGDNLQELRQVDKNPSQFWRDGMIRVVGREFNGLSESACFQRGEMSCLSCHMMHPPEDDPRPRAEWTDDQLKPEMRGNAACLSCHKDYQSETALAAHTHHAPASEGSRCYNCHMPNTTFGILKATRSHHLTSPSVAETTQAGRPNACNLCHLDQPLKWTEEKLVDWYGHLPQVRAEAWPETALGVELALAGDAGQRALIAWHMGWEPARQASGDDWLAPYLAILMGDDYPAVRFIAHRSLRQIGGYESVAYDSEMPPEERQNALRQITELWKSRQTLPYRASLLISETGELDLGTLSQILDQRDQTVMALEE